MHDNEVCSALRESTLLSTIYGDEDNADKIDCAAITVLICVYMCRLMIIVSAHMKYIMPGVG